MQIQRSKPRTGQPSERADHASSSSHGLHLGVGADVGATVAGSPSLTASTSTAASGTPSSGAQTASTPAGVSTPTSHSGGTSTPPPVAVEPPVAPPIEPPAAPQTPPLSAQPALTGARLDWILAGVVVALAGAVVAAVRFATLRGRRPPR
ncbi:MAG: hypothetical protein JOZ75_01410 [Candidatus Dormibacteraeota bacterium]|nr:hypothetical protein [Candidatus Dormibacteraeota bacterium]